MHRLFVALLVAGGVLALSRQVRADDLIRLGGQTGDLHSAAVHNLAWDGTGADTELAHWYRGGFYGGYRGYYGGYRGFYGYHGYRPFWGGGYYRPYYRPFVHGGFYRPYYYGGYFRPYYGVNYYYGSGYGYYYPCADDALDSTPTIVLGSSNDPPETQYVAPVPHYQGPQQTLPPARNGEPNYRYDGGPSNPIPGVAPTPAHVPPRPTVPREGRLVSAPSAPAPAATLYPAYGEQAPAIPALYQPARRPAAPTPAPAKDTFRLVYPAYGEAR